MSRLGRGGEDRTPPLASVPAELFQAVMRLVARGDGFPSVSEWLRVVGYVQTAPDFQQNAKVVNGFSDLIVDLWGVAGRHARSAPGQGPSPFNVPVIVDAIVAIDDA